MDRLISCARHFRRRFSSTLGRKTPSHPYSGRSRHAAGDFFTFDQIFEICFPRGLLTNLMVWVTAHGRFNLRSAGTCRSLFISTFGPTTSGGVVISALPGLNAHWSRIFTALYPYLGSGTGHLHHDSDLLLGYLCRRNHRHFNQHPRDRSKRHNLP